MSHYTALVPAQCLPSARATTEQGSKGDSSGAHLPVFTHQLHPLPVANAGLLISLSEPQSPNFLNPLEKLIITYKGGFED